MRSGGVDTPPIRAAMPNFDPEVAGARLPVKRFGTPVDIAHGVMFLLTNPGMSGSVLGIDGGGMLA